MRLHIGRLSYEVATLAEAQAIYERERDASGLGASDWPQGTVIGPDDKWRVRITYNGRMWDEGRAGRVEVMP